MDVLVVRRLVDRHVLELEHHVEFAASGVGVEPGLLGRHTGHLADGDEVGVPAAEHLAAHLREIVVYARPVGESIQRADESLPGDRAGIG